MPAAGDDVEKEYHSGRTSREDHAGKQSASFSQALNMNSSCNSANMD